MDAAERLRGEGASIRRVVLDNELKREYQQFLQERNRGRSDSDGRPDRTPEEIHRWAMEHHLPEHDGHVQFPDARIEYEDRDGRLRTRIWRSRRCTTAVVTPPPRRRLASPAPAPVRCASSARAAAAAEPAVGGRRYGLGITASTGKSGGRGLDPRLAEELLR